MRQTPSQRDTRYPAKTVRQTASVSEALFFIVYHGLIPQNSARNLRSSLDTLGCPHAAAISRKSLSAGMSDATPESFRAPLPAESGRCRKRPLLGVTPILLITFTRAKRIIQWCGDEFSNKRLFLSLLKDEYVDKAGMHFCSVARTCGVGFHVFADSESAFTVQPWRLRPGPIAQSHSSPSKATA